MENIFDTKEYKTISRFYGTQRAVRSQVPLMNHIDEGLDILIEQGASTRAQKAFCLHPIVQNDEDVDATWSDAYLLAVEYRNRANAYLCRPDTDYVSTPKDVYELVGPMSQDCALMLLADKRQNQKDFIRYHRGTHARSAELDRYFNIWLSYLHLILADYR